MKKRILSLLLSFVMVVCLLPTTAFADIPENMNTWQGRQITHVDFVAYYVDNLDENSYEKAHSLTVGATVDTDQIQFVPTSLTWKQGANGTATHTVKAKDDTSSVHSWQSVTTKTCQSLKDTEGKLFPLYRRGTGSLYRLNDSGKWDRVYESQMPKYISGDYCYRLYFTVLDQYLKNESTVANQYRIAPNATVTVKWLNSDKTEMFTVHPSTSMGICNYKEESLFVSTAGFLSPTISVTGTASLQMGSGKTIPSGYAKEAIKSFSVANLASGGKAPYTFSKVSDPNWITVSSDGTVSGTPSEAGAATTLTVKVTDSKGNSATTTINVGQVKAERIVIQSVELSGLYQPYANDDPANNRAGIVKVLDAAGNDITDTSPLKIAGIMSSWRVQGSSRSWNHFTGLFEADKTYQYALQFRIEGEANCAAYRLADDLTVTSSEFSDWTFKVGDYTDEATYQCRYAYSPSLTVNAAATQLSGTVTYTGAARFDAPLNAHVNISTTSVDASTLRWKWQYKDGSTWNNIGETQVGTATASITLNETQYYLKDRSIRAVVYSTDSNYAGTLYGAPLTVAKGWNMGIPTQPVVGLSSSGDYVTVTTDSFRGHYTVDENQRQEYIWTSAPSVDENGYAVWPEEGSSNIITTTAAYKQSVALDPNISTYYVYTRYKATDTTDAGRIIRAAMYTVPTASTGSGGGSTGGTGSTGSTGSGTSVTDVNYPDYPFGQRRIYIPVGGSVDVTYTVTPDGAVNNMPIWKSNTGDKVSVTQTAGKITLAVAADTTFTSSNNLQIIGPQKGESNTQPWYYYGSGTVWPNLDLYVYAYDPNTPTTVPRLNVGGGTIDLYEGDTYEFDFNALKAKDFLPLNSEGNPVVSKDNYTLSAWVYTMSTTGGTTIGTSNGSISITDNKITANAAGTGTLVYVYALASGESATSTAPIASYTVNVSARPALDNLSVTPGEVTLPVGDTYQLSAVATPAEAGGITWSVREADQGIVTVDSSTGLVTAVREGTASVYATCSDTTVYSVVTVVAPCADGHSFYYVSANESYHTAICGVCGHIEEELPHDLYDVASTESGKVHLKCLKCDYISEAITIPSGESSGSGPHFRPTPSTAATESTTNSAQTGDAGIALYALLALSSYTGTALVVRGRKRK